MAKVGSPPKPETLNNQLLEPTIKKISVFGLSTVMTVTVIKQLSGWGNVFDIDKKIYIFLYNIVLPVKP